MKTVKQLIAGIGIAMIVSSCVPARKYEELKAKEGQCQSELAKYKELASSNGATLKDVQVELEELKKDHEKLKQDTTELGRLYRQNKALYDDSQKLNREIRDQLSFLQKQAERESSKLSEELQEKQLELYKKEEALSKLENDLKDKTKLLKQREERVNELEELLQKQKEVVTTLKNKVAEALTGFKDKGLTVEERNGKVYVKMEAKLLFATGSTKVGNEGKKAITELAKVLEDQKDMEVVVEGHTDTDKLNSSKYPHNNWELSVLRATAVVEIMLASSSIDPKILAASGRSEFLPISEDKAKNRRIEIILTPNLDELFKIIQEG